MHRLTSRPTRIPPTENIHTFLVDWPKIHDNISDLKDIVETHVDRVTVLDNPDHYFSEQWNEMLRQFDGNFLLWVMGDVTLPPKFWELKDAAMLIFKTFPDIGIYGPDVEYTFHKWNTDTFASASPGVYEVPCAEPNCWFIRKEIIKKLQPIDVTLNRFGWGVDLMSTATAELSGYKTVRDYRFKAGHPAFTGYDEVDAEKQMQLWTSSLDPNLSAVMKRRWDWGLSYNLNWKRLNETKSI